MMARWLNGLIVFVTAKFIWLVQYLPYIKYIESKIIPFFIQDQQSRRGLNVNNPRCNLGESGGATSLRPILKGLNNKKFDFGYKSLFLKFNPFRIRECGLQRFLPEFHSGLFIFNPFRDYLVKSIQLLLFIIFFQSPLIVNAHEIRPAYLEIKQTTEISYQVLWKIPLLGNKAPKIDPILPDNFTLKQIDDEFLPDSYIRRYEGNYQQALNGKKIAIQGLDLTLVDVLIQINLLDESSYTLLLQPDNAEVIIPKEPNKWEVVQLYIKLGIEHILIGIDHLLFVLGLLLLVKGIKPLIQTITAFTVAHSITLGAATFNLINVPQAPVEAVIALSIVFLAREYISVKEGEESMTAKYPWIVAFTFGLLHGFGFAGALSEIGFPQKEVPLALFTFNVGVELGQLIFIGIVMILAAIFKKIKLPLPKWSWRILPYGMGIIAAFWLVERVVAFW